MVHFLGESFSSGQMAGMLSHQNIHHSLRYIGHEQPINRAPLRITEPGVLFGEAFYPASRFEEEGEADFNTYIREMMKIS